MITGPQLVEQYPVTSWRQGVGWTSEYAFEGERARVEEVGTAYSRAPGVVEVRFTQIGGELWRATVVFAGKTREEAQAPGNPDTAVEVAWAFPRNDLQRDIWTLPIVESELRNMSILYRGRFRADVESWIAGQLTVSVKGKDGTDSDMALGFTELVAIAVAFGANKAVIEAFLTTIAEGVSTYNYSRRVLRITRTGPTYGEWYKSNSNTNRCYTRSKLVSELNPPAWVSYKMPDGYWFKHEPEEEQVGLKLQMVQEYEYFGTRYSTFAYGDPIA